MLLALKSHAVYILHINIKMPTTVGITQFHAQLSLA